MGTPLGTAPDGAKYNQVINGHFYWYQEEWSNQGHTCLQRFTLPGSEPTATFTVTAGSGLAMTFNATGSTAPGGVADYVLAVQRLVRRPDDREDDADDHAHVPGGRRRTRSA